ncbi:ubiquinone biosynthesis accessory factor UbiJ [Undibacterium sp.]|jgi:ubiquinone biosynthesis protein UbiJ|uniref:ubiquinone biosynthesis accessory factor UbiJ n=1 Tax=Undibacterium sp. TaxID=1914977 RepID=UPI002BDF6C8B|nr:SCP2 sterol-binding domain-containing protein [Undibacterium sp.]HTD05907.1 SCP2 sterol-binding domain-containing protein [Undibacterium sp.]
MIPFSPFAPFINHLLAQEPWARDKLRLHAGKVAGIDLELFSLRLKVSADGMVEAAAADRQPDVKIIVKLSDLPLIAQNRERAFSYVKVEGDAEFANTISQLSQTLRWEAEEDLSKLFGDIAAVRMVGTAKTVVQTVKETHQKLQENLAEYFLEENPMLVRPAAVAALGNEVNKIRDDVERLTKRIEKLERLR